MVSSIVAIVSSFLVLQVGGALAQNGCAQGWTRFEDSCYYVHYHDKYNWMESIGFCNIHKAHLVYVDNGGENDFMKKLITNVTVYGQNEHNPNLWIGASDEILEGHYMWYGIEEPLTYTDWYPGEPNSVRLGLIEDCVAYYSAWKLQWADLSCDAKAFFICEKSSESGGEIIG